MKGFILSAGFGERLSPITNYIPKSLIPVVNIPSICYAIMLLKEAGIMDVLCNLHYKSIDILEFFKKNNNFGLNITFSIEDNILGTGGGIKKCEELLHDDDFIVINSDIIMDINLSDVIEYHEEKGHMATIVLQRVEGTNIIGSVAVEGSRIIDFKNFLNASSFSNFTYTGVAVLSPIIFNYLKEEFSSIVYTGFVDIIRFHTLSFFEHKGLWLDIGSIYSFWEANMKLIKDKEIFNNRFQSTLGKGLKTVFESSFIDEGVSVIDSVVGEECFIGKRAIIEKSVLLPQSKVFNDITIKNSVVIGDMVLEL